MIKHYRSKRVIEAEQFDGSQEQIKRYGIIRGSNRDDYYFPVKGKPSVLFKVGDFITHPFLSVYRVVDHDTFLKGNEEIIGQRKAKGEGIETN